jgi:hypothetical protein
MVPSRTAMPCRAHSLMITLTSHPPSMSSTPSIIAPHAMDPSKASVLQGAGAVKPSLSTIAMVLATSSETALARNPTLLQLTTVM